MNKKTVLIFAAAGIGAVTISKLLTKKQRFTAEELETIDKYKEYLEEKDFVIVRKNDYGKKIPNLFSISSLPLYYKAAKTVAKFIL